MFSLKGSAPGVRAFCAALIVLSSLAGSVRGVTPEKLREEVHQQAKAGRDFDDLARKYSADSSAERGGDLGFFTKDRMVPQFADAAFALTPGQISDIVQTSYGYHVIKVMDRRPAGDIPLAQVTAQVREYLTQQRQREKADALVTVLRNKSRIEVLI